MEKRIRVSYIGHSPYMVQALMDDDRFELESILIQDKKKGIASCYRRYILRQIPIYLVTGREWFYAEENSSALAELCVMHEFGLLVPEYFLKKHRVVNFHPGDLQTNRGANPISWAILDGLEYTVMSMYFIAPQFDLGKLIATAAVAISEGDGTDEVREKMNHAIPQLLDELYRSEKDGRIELQEVTEGKYRRRVSEEDYTIHVGEDSMDVMKRKINSQKAYRGAVLLREHAAVYIRSVTDAGNWYLFMDENGKEIFVEKENVRKNT